MSSIVQRTTDVALTPASGVIQRQSGGHGPGCGCPACGATVQRAPQATVQRAYGSTWSPVAPIGPAPNIRPIHTRKGVVQRHASWEHRALGDVKPEELSTLATWQEATDHYKEVGEGGDIELEGQEVKPADIMHIIQQEVERLKVWQNPENTPKSGGKAAADQLKHIANDPEWGLHIVEIPGVPEGADSVVLTYGELNTLADFYGSADELLKTNSTAVLNVVQSVRQQSFEQLLEIYMKLKDTKDTAEAKEELGATDLKFKGAFNITGTAGELGQMAMDKKGSTSPETAYTATLARNACHFAPESWHSWEDWHTKALAKAKEAYDLHKAAQEDTEQSDMLSNDLFELDFDAFFSEEALGGAQGVASSDLLLAEKEDPSDSEEGESDPRLAQARSAENLALIYNGFGDHYLQ
ncbi:MAG: hypothetical protein ACRC1H_16085, partial [Caldilineaceae bacterium]